MTNKLILYIGNSCPYCVRVLDYLRLHPLDIQIKDVWSDEMLNQELLTLTGRGQVPCLRMGDHYMHESLDIIEKLKEMSATTNPSIKSN